MTTLKSTASGVCAAIYRTKGLLRAMPYAVGLLLLVSACNKENDQNPLLSYEIALDAFVADLQANPLDSAGLSDRVRFIWRHNRGVSLVPPWLRWTTPERRTTAPIGSA